MMEFGSSQTVSTMLRILGSCQQPAPRFVLFEDIAKRCLALLALTSSQTTVVPLSHLTVFCAKLHSLCWHHWISHAGHIGPTYDELCVCGWVLCAGMI